MPFTNLSVALRRFRRPYLQPKKPADFIMLSFDCISFCDAFFAVWFYVCSQSFLGDTCVKIFQK